MKLCECGVCGLEVTKEENRFIKGHWIRIRHPMKNPEIAKKSGKSKEGRISWNLGLTKENNESVKNVAEKLTGRTKENNEGRRKQAEFMLNGGSFYVRSFITEKSRRKGAEKISGPNNYRWNPDREQVFVPYTEEFEINKPKVRKRDKYICQLCFKPGRTVHHIDENKQDSSLENMITLCRSCHIRIHNKDKGIWLKLHQSYFKCVISENKFLTKEQVEQNIKNLRNNRPSV